jgi:hypothetical protein
MSKKKSPKKAAMKSDVAQPAGPIGRGKMAPKIDYRRLLKNKSTPSSVVPYSAFNKNARPYDYAVGALRARANLNPLAYTTPTGPATWFGSLGDNADSAIVLANLQNAMNRGSYAPTFEDYIRGNVVANPLDRQMEEQPEPEQERDSEPMQEQEQEQEQTYVPMENPVAPMQANAPTADHAENMRLREELRMYQEYMVNQYRHTTTTGTEPMEQSTSSTPVATEIAVQTEPEIVVWDERNPMFPARVYTHIPPRIPPIRIRVKRRAQASPEEDARYGDAQYVGNRIGDVATM